MSYLLFADDSEAMREMVRELLASGGHEVGVVPDGESALVSVAEREPDLLLLDLNMPGMSGLDVCRTVKANPFTSQIPVLMLTGQGSIEFKLEGFDAGADDYLPKPFDPRELRARVAALLRLVQREADRNPTSGLPGGRAISAELERRRRSGLPFEICYLDIDNFKPFADRFGFAVADAVIRGTGRALLEAARVLGTEGDLVGHIGGDDFILVTVEGAAESIAEQCASRFRGVIGALVGEAALEAGVFEGVDRDGVRRLFPIAQISTVILTVDPEESVSTTHLGEVAAEMKRQAKQRGGGTIVRLAV